LGDKFMQPQGLLTKDLDIEECRNRGREASLPT